MDNIFDIFMIAIIVIMAFIFTIISKRVFYFIFRKDLPLEVLKNNLKTNGFTFKSCTETKKKLLPENINFDQLWSLFSLYYVKHFYKILVTDDIQKNEEYIYLKYYQSTLNFLSDKYYFKKQDSK